MAAGDIWRIPNCSRRSCLDLLIPVSGALLLAVVTAGLLFRRMGLLEGNTRSGPEPSLESLFSFCLGVVDFSDSQHQTPHICWFSAVCAGQEPPGRRRRRRKNLFWSPAWWWGLGLADWGLDWKDKMEMHTLCLVTGRQMVSQTWIFCSPCYFPPSGQSFPASKGSHSHGKHDGKQGALLAWEIWSNSWRENILIPEV